MGGGRYRVAIALLTVGLGASASAQSLADLARKTSQDRTEAKAPARTYTNGNLTPDFTTPAVAAPVAPAASASAPEAAGELRRDPAVAASGREGGPVAPADESLDEAYWRRGAKALNLRVEAARQAVANPPLPAGESERELARVQEYVAKAQAQLTRAQNDLQIFLMQADVAKVPKAWLQ